jgi:hypothetical protein
VLRRRLAIAGATALLLASASTASVVVVWLVLPPVAALFVVAVSIHSIRRDLRVTQVLLGLPAMALSAISLWTLTRMFVVRAWPTYLPYYAIAFAGSIAAIQASLARRRTRPIRGTSGTSGTPGTSGTI